MLENNRKRWKLLEILENLRKCLKALENARTC